MRAKIFVHTCTKNFYRVFEILGGQGPPTRNPRPIYAWEGGFIHMRAHLCLLTFIIVLFSITSPLPFQQQGRNFENLVKIPKYNQSSTDLACEINFCRLSPKDFLRNATWQFIESWISWLLLRYLACSIIPWKGNALLCASSVHMTASG